MRSHTTSYDVGVSRILDFEVKVENDDLNID
jgi:hypothetical protein